MKPGRGGGLEAAAEGQVERLRPWPPGWSAHRSLAVTAGSVACVSQVNGIEDARTMRQRDIIRMGDQKYW